MQSHVANCSPVTGCYPGSTPPSARRGGGYCSTVTIADTGRARPGLNNSIPLATIRRALIINDDLALASELAVGFAIFGRETAACASPPSNSASTPLYLAPPATPSLEFAEQSPGRRCQLHRLRTFFQSVTKTRHTCSQPLLTGTGRKTEFSILPLVANLGGRYPHKRPAILISFGRQLAGRGPNCMFGASCQRVERRARGLSPNCFRHLRES